MATYGTVAVVGVGLIGGSIGRALRERALAGRVVGVGRNEANLADALRVGAIDRAETDLARGVSEADVVVVCTPVGQVAALALAAAAAAPDGVLLTDAGSTKRTIVEAVERNPRGRAAFVGGHPIAGSERQGAAHSDGGLFEGRVCVLTPTGKTPPDRLGRARAFWASIGCRTIELDPARHDEALALTSHLPHVLASALAGVVPPEAFDVAAGAYRDMTRVAGADGALWSAIFLENRGPILDAIGRFDARLRAFRDALEAGDAEALDLLWEAARQARGGFRFERPAWVKD